jgi:hypothetical protein
VSPVGGRLAPRPGQVNFDECCHTAYDKKTSPPHEGDGEVRGRETMIAAYSAGFGTIASVVMVSVTSSLTLGT